MTFQSISSLTSQRELATSGMFACSFTVLPVASLPSDWLLPIVIENQSERGFPQPKPHGVLSWSPQRIPAAISGYPAGSVTVPLSGGGRIIPPVNQPADERQVNYGRQISEICSQTVVAEAGQNRSIKTAEAAGCVRKTIRQ